MLQITVPATESDELWNEEITEFVSIPAQKEQTLRLEHSLVSLSKWESRWRKSFFSKTEKTNEEVVDYIRCMTLTKNVDPNIFTRLGSDNIRKINEYIEAPMTATVFSDNKTGSSSREVITSELIYYWMIALNIPFECQKWHINRLLTLIRVCEIKSQPPKKMSRREIMTRNASLNAVRRKQLNSRG